MLTADAVYIFVTGVEGNFGGNVGGQLIFLLLLIFSSTLGSGDLVKNPFTLVSATVSASGTCSGSG